MSDSDIQLKASLPFLSHGLRIFSASKRFFSSIRNFSSIQIVLFQRPGFLQHRTAGVFSASRVFSASMVFSQPSKESIFLASEQCFLRLECFFDA